MKASELIEACNAAMAMTGKDPEVVFKNPDVGGTQKFPVDTVTLDVEDHVYYAVLSTGE
jgi:hypothetical protein